MAVNENSRVLPLLHILHNVKNEAEDLCVKSIRDVIKTSMIASIIQLIGIIIGKNWLLIIPFIDGDTFKIMEVNVELVIIWISKANQVIGRAKFISTLFPLITILITFIILYSTIII